MHMIAARHLFVGDVREPVCDNRVQASGAFFSIQIQRRQFVVDRKSGVNWVRCAAVLGARRIVQCARNKTHDVATRRRNMESNSLNSRGSPKSVLTTRRYCRHQRQPPPVSQPAIPAQVKCQFLLKRRTTARCLNGTNACRACRVALPVQLRMILYRSSCGYAPTKILITRAISWPSLVMRRA